MNTPYIFNTIGHVENEYVCILYMYIYIEYTTNTGNMNSDYTLLSDRQEINLYMCLYIFV